MIQQVVNPYRGTPPSTSEYNLTTDYQVDDLGRKLQTLGPSFNVDGQLVRTASWTVYLDVLRQVLSASGFATGSNNGPQYNFTLVNPVSIDMMDFAGHTTDAISAVRASTVGPLSASDSFPQISWVRWTHSHFDNAGNLTATDVYFAIPPDGAGLPGLNYNRTRYGYDAKDRRNMVRSPDGTITRTVFDFRNHPTEITSAPGTLRATDKAPDGSAARQQHGQRDDQYLRQRQPGGRRRPADNGDQPHRRHDGERPPDRLRLRFPRSLDDHNGVHRAHGDCRFRHHGEHAGQSRPVTQMDQYNTTIADASRIRRSQTFYDNLAEFIRRRFTPCRSPAAPPARRARRKSAILVQRQQSSCQEFAGRLASLHEDPVRRGETRLGHVHRLFGRLG